MMPPILAAPSLQAHHYTYRRPLDLRNDAVPLATQSATLTTLKPPTSPYLSIADATPASEPAEDSGDSPPPETTPLPIDQDDVDIIGNAVRFVQTTYYSCVTIGTDSHCGWHEPILDASNNASGQGRTCWVAVARATVGSILAILLATL